VRCAAASTSVSRVRRCRQPRTGRLWVRRAAAGRQEGSRAWRADERSSRRAQAGSACVGTRSCVSRA